MPPPHLHQRKSKTCWPPCSVVGVARTENPPSLWFLKFVLLFLSPSANIYRLIIINKPFRLLIIFHKGIFTANSSYIFEPFQIHHLIFYSSLPTPLKSLSQPAKGFVNRKLTKRSKGEFFCPFYASCLRILTCLNETMVIQRRRQAKQEGVLQDLEYFLVVRRLLL